MDEIYLILDMGTGNSRAGLVKGNGEILGLRTFENTYYRDFQYQDAQYFYPREWEKKMVICIKELLAAFPDISISGITSTSARESVVLLDREGNAFYGLPNVDNRGSDWMEEISDPEKIYYDTGRWVSPVFSALKLLGLRKVHGDIFNRIAGITSLSDWMGYFFTGRLVMEASQACETQLYDIHRHQWSQELCEKFGISRSILPEVVHGGEILGTIREDLQRELGLSRHVVFRTGGADTQTAVKGIRGDHGGITIVSGTTSPIVKIVTEDFYDPRQRCWTDCYLEKERYQIETNAGVSGLNYQRLKRMLFPDVSYGELDEKMGQKERISCVASFGTLVFSENRSLKNGGFYLSAPLEEACDRYDFAYACVGDIACSIYEEYKNLCEITRDDGHEILCCGGGFQSGILCQMLTDLSGKRLILRPGYDQASILGCVRLCGEQAESQPPDMILREYKPGGNALIHEYYEKWKNIRRLIN